MKCIPASVRRKISVTIYYSKRADEIIRRNAFKTPALELLLRVESSRDFTRCLWCPYPFEVPLHTELFSRIALVVLQCYNIAVEELLQEFCSVELLKMLLLQKLKK